MYCSVCIFFLLFSFGIASLEDEIRMDVQTVHIIFMTHLDIGYTENTAQAVLLRYFNEHFPNAISVAQQLRNRSGEERFIWTSHPWLIHQYLRNGTQSQLSNLKEAIQQGDIQWHAAGCNIQYELMDGNLFDYSLQLAQQLDEMFNKPKKICMSLKDVPGLTRGIIPIAAKRGIKAIHVGVNDFSTVPAVPDTSPYNTTLCNPFIWQDLDTSTDVIAMWCNGYSWQPWGIIPELEVLIPGFNQALVFLMRVDNTGPPSVDDVITGWANVQKKFPQAKLIASSLDDFVTQLETVRDNLPVRNYEVGDTWIYGVPSDPRKMREYKIISRLLEQAIKDGKIDPSDPRVQLSSELLVKSPEHTWGNSNYVAGNYDYSNEKFHQEMTALPFIQNEQSWTEQRWYNYRAIDALGNLPLAQEMRNALASVEPQIPNFQNYIQVDPSKLGHYQCFNTIIGFDSSTGAINFLLDQKTQKKWADDTKKIGLISYQTFSQKQYDDFGRAYNLYTINGGFDRFNLYKIPDPPQDQRFFPNLTMAYTYQNLQSQCTFIMVLKSPPLTLTKYGAPTSFYITLNVSRDETGSLELNFDVQWFDKIPTRLPEAIWFSMNPQVGDPQDWYLQKIESLISPYDVVINGSRSLHAVARVIHGKDQTNPSVIIDNPHVPVVSPGNATLLVFDNNQPNCDQGMHFNLYNNLWNTNYPLWYSQDERFQFILRFNSVVN